MYRQDLCWSHLGIPLRGRSRILRRVYRNTVEISRYASTCIREVGAVAEDLAAYGEEWIEADLDHPWARHGAEPILRGFDTAEAEREFLVAETRALLNQGRSPMDILVLQARRDSAALTAKVLRDAGIPAAIVKESRLTFEPPSVNVWTYHSAKGLEFPVVFCSMTHVFPASRRADRQDDLQQLEAEAAGGMGGGPRGHGAVRSATGEHGGAVDREYPRPNQRELGGSGAIGWNAGTSNHP